MNTLMDLLFFVLGGIIGSFLNVCIYRLPREKSIVTPGSSCPHCGKSISFYHNVPLVSYLMLRGKCRHCGTDFGPIFRGRASYGSAVRSPLPRVGAIVGAGSLSPFCHVLIVISFIDLEFRIIPDTLSLGGLLVGVGFSFFRAGFNYKDAFWGILLGGGVLWVIAFMYELVRKQEGMGGGDIKFLAMIGAFCGIKGVLFSLVSGSLLGSLVGIPLMIVKHADAKYALPFGPFLSFGAVLYVLTGDRIIYAFINVISPR